MNSCRALTRLGRICQVSRNASSNLRHEIQSRNITYSQVPCSTLAAPNRFFSSENVENEASKEEPKSEPEVAQVDPNDPLAKVVLSGFKWYHSMDVMMAVTKGVQENRINLDELKEDQRFHQLLSFLEGGSVANVRKSPSLFVFLSMKFIHFRLKPGQ